MEKHCAITRMFSLKRSILFTTLGLALISGSALAGQPAFSLDSPYMFGDWGGYRSQLKEDGVDFQVNYTMESAANLSGGYHHATSMRYTDQWAFGTTLDLDKLLNWQDATFQMTITSRNGQDLSSYINDPRSGGLSSVQEVWGRGQTWRMTQFWLNQGLFNNLLEVKAGRVTVGEDFDTIDNSYFQNLAFGGGQPGNWRGDRWFNWPVSQWGGRIKLNLPDNAFFQVGFYNQNRANYDRGNGFRFDMRHSEGNLVPVELGWQPSFGPENLKGNYRLGMYYSSVNGDVYNSYRNGDYQRDAHSYGGYLLAQQKIMTFGNDANRGMDVRFQYVMNDHKTSKMDSYQSLAVVWTGIWDARPQDELGFGVSRIHLNNDYSKMLRQKNAESGITNYDNPAYVPQQHGNEWDYEIYYNIKATNWLNLRPNLQYVQSPGGVDQVDDAFIGGISANINF